MALQDAIAALQDIVGGISGIKAATDQPPEAINQYPFALAYPSVGKEVRISDFRKGIHTIVCEIHFSRQNLPKAIALATPYLDTFMNAVFSNPTLSGTVSTIQEEIRYEFGFLPWGGVADVNIGWRFEVDVKIQTSIS